ncbi:predicted protein [Lichtheimia corymbifera JMRC:FSU:9682]|uniref:Uncharacterized protein n=1 Tax=Lichtheimia corymbifera JMRC:FSU:9682 TaxID=1263082 RepID=A0A068RIX1_9FUNG|nr:predicted protein [Lichtheimia corymbifera JMRC:FSU:9682]
MTTIQPIVTVSFSSWVSSVGFPDFLHHHDLTLQAGNRYLQYVGIFRLVAMLDQQWVDNDGTDATRQQRLTIIIPHIDPGYELYGEQHRECSPLSIANIQRGSKSTINQNHFHYGGGRGCSGRRGGCPRGNRAGQRVQERCRRQRKQQEHEQQEGNPSSSSPKQ